MSNLEIVTNEATLKNYPFDGSNLFTYKEWMNRGYCVQKGQTAFIKTKLWQKTSKKNKDTGKTETYFVQVNTSLFTIDQVSPLQAKLSAK